MKTNGVIYNQVFAKILENVGKQQMVTLVTAQVNMLVKFIGQILFCAKSISNTYVFRRLDRTAL